MDSRERSLLAFPSGSNGEFGLPPDLATVIASGDGCELRTVDGKQMLDFSMGWGSVLVGHGRPEVADAVCEQVHRGSNFAYVTDQSLALAEELIRLSPCCDQVRFCASGTEATMYCLRLARASTGRQKVLKFEGAYHGAHDVGVASLFPLAPAEYPRSQSSSAGVEPGGETSTLVAPFNDLEAACHVIESNAEDLAGVIVEPLQRCVPPGPGFLEGIREITSRLGIRLIFDEVVTGFRLAYGGAQAYFGVVPDLVAYGKALGGGLPIGAFGGRRDIMELVGEQRLNRDTYVWTASTLGGNPVSASAANAALQIYRQDDTYPTLHRLGNYLRSGMQEVLASKSVEAIVLGDGPLAQIAFTSTAVRDYRSSQHRRRDFARRVMLELFSRGIFLNPMGTKLYLSLAHDESVCDIFFERLGDALSAAESSATPAPAGAISR